MDIVYDTTYFALIKFNRLNLLFKTMLNFVEGLCSFEILKIHLHTIIGVMLTV